MSESEKQKYEKMRESDEVRYREHLDIGQIPRMGRNFSFNASVIF